LRPCAANQTIPRERLKDNKAGQSGHSEKWGKNWKGWLAGLGWCWVFVLSVQWGKLFQVLEGLGIRVMVDVPESVATYLNDPARSQG